MPRLFVGVTLFEAAVLLLLGRSPRWLGAVALTVVVCCLLRFTLEMLGRPRASWTRWRRCRSLALVAALSVLSFRGSPCPDRRCFHRLA